LRVIVSAQEVPLEKTPPQSQEAEMSLLGSILMDKLALDKAAEKLTPEMFYNLSHQTIFSAALELYENATVVDVVTLTDKLRSSNQLDAVGGTVYLTDLIDSVSTTAHTDSWIRIIADKHTLRSLIGVATSIVQRCFDRPEDADELLDRAEVEIFDIAEKRITESYKPMKSLLPPVVDQIEKLHENKHFVSGIPSGFHDLDELTSGFQDSDMIILAARPSMGKTSMALRMVETITVENQIPVAVFSLEMSSEQLTQRMLCSRARLNSQAVRKGIFEQKRWRDITKAASDLTKAPIYLNDTPGLNPLQLRAIARRLKATHDIRMIFVDYLQLMQGASRRYDSRQAEISEISRSMKSLARELKVPIMVLSQLNREVESRPGRRPQLSDLRESGAIEQDADVVMLLVRPEVYDPLVRPGLGDVMVAKQRNGPTGDFEVAFLSDFARFEPASDRVEPEEMEEVKF
jgi:replicative DNA helicase